MSEPKMEVANLNEVPNTTNTVNALEKGGQPEFAQIFRGLSKTSLGAFSKLHEISVDPVVIKLPGRDREVLAIPFDYRKDEQFTKLATEIEGGENPALHCSVETKGESGYLVISFNEADPEETLKFDPEAVEEAIKNAQSEDVDMAA